MAQAIFALSSPHQARNPDSIAVLNNEWMAATYVWVNLSQNSAKQRRLNAHVAAIEDRIRTIRPQPGVGR